MGKTLDRSIRSALGVVALAVAVSAPSLAEGLLAGTASGGGLGLSSHMAKSALRARPVEIDLASLAAALEPGTELRLDLFADLSLTAIAESVRMTGAESMVWKGGLAGDPQGRVVLVLSEGVVAASIAASDRRFLITPGRADRHVVSELDLARLPIDEDDAVLPKTLGPAAGSKLRAANERSGAVSTVDVAVVYTRKARQAAGGNKALKALIKLAVAEVNIALEDSRVDTRVALAKARKVPYDETNSIPTDLERLQLAGDGFLDKAHKIRSGARADLVMLVVDAMDPNRCGRAYLSPMASRPADWAFGALRYDCLNAEYSFGHELGHIMGLAHARGGAAGQAYLPYGHGYDEPRGRFRTMMAIRQAGGGPRVLHFSNPAVKEKGRPTGVAHTDRDAADSARAINAARQLLASYR